MTTLIVLAYNEEKNLEKTLSQVHKNFDEIIIVNDGSKDKTEEVLNKLERQYKNLKIINNKKNNGAGKSFQIAINEFLNSDSQYFIKIDGDGQFKSKDIIFAKKLIEENKDVDFIKFDRFWQNGIEGNIPTIRYVGNAFASFLIKISTGNWYLNDPLNGLQVLSRKASKLINIPKLFNRYGYPFYIATTISNNSMIESLKVIQSQNTIVYDVNKKSIKPSIMLFKLLIFSIYSFYKKIIAKLKFSNLQLSAILDMVSILFFLSSVYSLSEFLKIRYFNSIGPQGNWFLLFIMLIILFFTSMYQSQKIESAQHLVNFKQINKNE